MIDKLMDWYFKEKDSALQLAKIFVITLILMILVICMPVWIIPYLIYKKILD